MTKYILLDESSKVKNVVVKRRSLENRREPPPPKKQQQQQQTKLSLKNYESTTKIYSNLDLNSKSQLHILLNIHTHYASV